MTLPEPDDKPISIAILALGGQGGGVLTGWIVSMAESQGWHAQSTSVPGVAQRTGATLYYVELMKAKPAATPVFALMPTPGDVDIVIAAEWMEAGRGVLRGLVTPDRTILIASTHRMLAIAEKETPDGMAGDSQAVAQAASFAARRLIAFDMDAIARSAGTIISAPLFGALAGSGALPFSLSHFRSQIVSSGKSAPASLRAFDDAAGRCAASDEPALPPKTGLRFQPIPDRTGQADLDQLVDRIKNAFAEAAWPMIFAGVSRLVDYQDVRYANLYLDRLAEFRAPDHSAGCHALTIAAARAIAAAMSYDDVIRVADLKTRRERFKRIEEMQAPDGTAIVDLTEHMHPGAAEIVGLLPRRLGLLVERSPRLCSAIGRLLGGARKVKTSNLGWFFLLYCIGGLRRFRRATLRHAREMQQIDHWLEHVWRHSSNRELAIEMLSARHLVKGYSETRGRGLAKFQLVMDCADALHARADGGMWMRRLIAAAQKDESMEMLAGAVKTVQSLPEPISEGPSP